MKWGILIFFPGSINIVLQCFFTAAKASVNSGNLIIGNGEELKINTTAPSIVKNNCRSCNYNASHENRSSSSSHSEHLAAVITFSGNIEFRNGSTVKVSGKYALSIKSQKGHILIETDINMTCTEMVLNETCLGGFTQSSGWVNDNEGERLYKGLGPGGFQEHGVFKLASTCIPGSSHGGIALKKGYDKLYSGPAYGQQDTGSLLGGSGGSCALHPGSVAGGGAIEIVAVKGCITINAVIRASAQSETDNTKPCSGGAGGLIRLNALQVQLKEQGKLIVDGENGKGKIGPGGAYDLGGGSGGVIQIISSAGRLPPRALSLKRGKKNGTCKPEAEHGYYYFVGDNSINASDVEMFPATNPYNWSSSSSQPSPLPCFSGIIPTHQSATTDIVLSPSASQVQSSPPPTAQGTTRVNEFIRNWEAIYTSLIQGGKLNESAVLENLATHKLLLSRTPSSKDLDDLCLNIYKNYTAIEFEIAKLDLDFAVVSLQGILNAASDCVLEKNHDFWMENQQMPNLMEALEDVLIATVNGNSSLEIDFTLTTSNIVAQVERNVVKALKGDIKIPHYSKVPEDSWKKESDYALIPKETLKDGKGVWLFSCYQ